MYALGEIMTAGFFTGSHQILMDAFDAEAALRLVEKHRIVALHGFETHWADLLRAHETSASHKPREPV